MVLRRFALVRDADVLNECVVACISLLFFLALRYVMTAVVYMCFMFCSMCASVTFLCVLMYVVYLLNAVLFSCCILCKRVECVCAIIFV